MLEGKDEMAEENYVLDSKHQGVEMVWETTWLFASNVLVRDLRENKEQLEFLTRFER
jgi:hypothetical protein